jgi:TetR/AcrR family transcriptional regulator, cholesterol catabolism regulator
MTAETQDRRTLIVSSAAEMFARKGIGATTVREIADAVGVLSGSLYHHFESKDAIVEEILAGFLDTIQARYATVLDSGRPPAECLHDLVLASLRVASEQPYATAIYQNELHYLREQPKFAEVLAAAGRVQQTWLRVIEQGVTEGAFRADIDPRVFYRLIRDAVWLSVRWHHHEAPERLADDITSIFLDGFSA